MVHECSQLLSLCLCSDSVGWSGTNKFRTPPAAGSDETSFVIYGDMGKAPLDPSVEHYIQVGEIVASKQEMLQSDFFLHCLFICHTFAAWIDFCGQGSG